MKYAYLLIAALFNKPFHPSTNPEILVMIGPLDSEIPVLESRSLKIYKKGEKKSAKYMARSAV